MEKILNNFKSERNFEKLQQMLLIARENGNKNALSLKSFKEAGISEVIFNTYKKDIEKLYNSAVEYVTYKHSKEVDSKKLNTLSSKIFTYYKIVIDYTKAEDETIFVCNKDVEDIVSFTSKFMNDEDGLKNNAINSVNMFRKNIEIMLGIKLANKEVLTEEEARIIRAKRNLTKKVNTLQDKIAELESALKLVNNDEDKAIINAKITENKSKKAESENKLAELYE